MNWAPANSNIEILHHSTAYCIDYSITGSRRVQSLLTAFRKKQTKWHPTDIDADLKTFVEETFNKLFPIWYDEVIQQEEENEKIKQERITDYRSMQNTYETLQKQF
ncbi:hypothetical protein LJB95_03120 [Paludibacteraceae bacterium OttesenSCG-928-F17]|nr:hypothetical protein [Paludibacteraceae bacterium OttesenSCG-928-F17]